MPTHKIYWESPFDFKGCRMSERLFNGYLRIFIKDLLLPEVQSDEYSIPIHSIDRDRLFITDENCFYFKQVILYEFFDRDATEKILTDFVKSLPTTTNPKLFFSSYLEYQERWNGPLPQPRNMSQQIYRESSIDFYWTLDDDTQDPKDWEFFDERLTAHLSWTYEGKLYELKCYGYMTSIAFLEERIKTKSPYYRRFMYVVKYFHHKYVDEWLGNIFSEANSIHPLDREKFLMQYAEVEGQPNFYER